MKKLLIVALLLSSGCISTISHASEFSDKYPNFSRMNKIILKQQIMYGIAANQGLIQGGTDPKNKIDSKGKPGNPDIANGWNQALGEMVTSLKQENQCLNNIVASPIVPTIETQLVKKVPASELTAFENFYTTPTGQKMLGSFEKVFDLLYKGDMKAFESYSANTEKDFTQQDKENIKAFDDQHKATSKTLIKIFEDKNIASQIEKYQETCKPAPLH